MPSVRPYNRPFIRPPVSRSCQSISLSISLSVCLSVCLSVSPSVCLSVCLSVCCLIGQSVSWSVVCPFVCPAVRLTVGRSVRLFVGLSVRLSHAQCTGCKRWKNRREEEWKRHQVWDNRTRGCPLLCTVCKSKSGLLECTACKVEKVRKSFAKGLLAEKKRTPSCLLVCLVCTAREGEILARMRLIDAKMCHCKCTTFRHQADCKFPRRGHNVTDAELAFVSFRPSTKRRYGL